MGNRSRVFKNLAKARQLPRMALSDTHIAVNGCQVFLGHPDPTKAKQTAESFKKMLSVAIARSRVPNMSDMYNAHFQMCERLKAGETIEEIMQ